MPTVSPTPRPPRCRRPLPPSFFAGARAVDVLIAVLVAGLGIWFLGDHARWAAWWVFVGKSPTGDAAFWWSGVLDAWSGDIATNVNLNFRMGFAMIGGLITSLLGPNVYAFHAVLVGAFVTGAVLMYFALRPVVGRVYATGAVLLLVLNPFIAEWLANMTSDGLGLTFNLLALAFVIVGLRGRGRLLYLVLFALFLALAGLTRPLMNLFIGPALVILLFVHASWARRGVLVAVTLFTYLVPVVGWMLVLHAQIGTWSVAGHSGSIFYSASDPKVQVWTPEIYSMVMKGQDLRHVTAWDLDREFSRGAVTNYLTHWRYHLDRVLPTAWGVAISAANVSYRSVSNPWEGARTCRLWLLLGMCIAGLGLALYRGNALGFAAILLTGILIVLQLDRAQAVLILASGVLFSLALLRRDCDKAFPSLGLFVLVALGSMYLVGGVSSPAGKWGVNMLGLRLSSQYSMAADLSLGLMLGWIARWTVPARFRAIGWVRAVGLTVKPVWRPGYLATRRLVRRVRRARPMAFLYRRRPGLPRLMGRVAAVVGIAAAVFVVIGGVRLTASVIRLEELVGSRPFPSAQAVMPEVEARLRERGFTGQVDLFETWNQVGGWVYGKQRQADRYVLAPMGLSPLISNIPGQRRSHARFFLQDGVRPFTIGFAILDGEFPRHLDEGDWEMKQGAWLLRWLPDGPPATHLLFYNSFPSVHAFVPLNEAGDGYDLDRMVWFDDAASLSELDAMGLLTTDAIEAVDTPWPDDAGRRKHYPRARTFTAAGETLTVDVDTRPARGGGELAFGIEILSIDPQPSPATLEVLRRAPGSAEWTPVETVTPQPGPIPRRLHKNENVQSFTAGAARVDLAATPADAVRLRVTGLRRGDRVRLTEFALRAPQLEL